MVYEQEKTFITNNICILCILLYYCRAYSSTALYYTTINRHSCKRIIIIMACIYGLLNKTIPINNYRDTISNGFSDQWDVFGPMSRRTNDTLFRTNDFRTNDTFSDQWVFGPMGFRTNGSSDQWVFGLMSRRTNGLSDHRDVGLHVESVTRQHSFSSSYASCACDKHLLANDTPRKIINCYSLALLPMHTNINWP